MSFQEKAAALRFSSSILIPKVNPRPPIRMLFYFPFATNSLQRIWAKISPVRESETQVFEAGTMPDKFDLLLLDLHMPELDGFEVVRAIRHWEGQTGGHLPVIALTARSRVEDRERCREAGVDDFLLSRFG